MECITCPVTIEGLEGSVELTGAQVELRGPWASHTGYRSILSFTSDIEDVEKKAEAVAREHFLEQKKFPFLVGNEHADFGWKMIRENYKGEIEVRLPDWHKGIVASCLESYGTVMTDRINCFWTFPLEEGVSMATVKALLAPIRANETRFYDESELAEKINSAALCLGFVAGVRLSQGAIQASLF